MAGVPEVADDSAKAHALTISLANFCLATTTVAAVRFASARPDVAMSGSLQASFTVQSHAGASSAAEWRADANR